MDSLHKQVDGNHYKDMAIQPVEYIHANGIGYFEGNVIKYVTRWRAKNGIADLEKAKHYIELLIELEEKAKGLTPAASPSWRRRWRRCAPGYRRARTSSCWCCCRSTTSSGSLTPRAGRCILHRLQHLL